MSDDDHKKSIGEIFAGREHLLTPEMLEVIHLLNRKLAWGDRFRVKYHNLVDVIHESVFASDLFLIPEAATLTAPDVVRRIMDHLEKGE